MIAYLAGKLARLETDWVVVNVNGVGYKVSVPLTATAQFSHIGDSVELLVSTVVREDAISLYGFISELEQSVFELLILVSGVGPIIAMAALSVMGGDSVISAISSENHKALSSVPGIGNKTAQRIVLETKDKADILRIRHAVSKESVSAQLIIDDAISALMVLGYNRNDARSAVDKASASSDTQKDTGNIIRAALKLLSKG